MVVEASYLVVVRRGGLIAIVASVLGALTATVAWYGRWALSFVYLTLREWLFEMETANEAFEAGHYTGRIIPWVFRKALDLCHLGAEFLLIPFVFFVCLSVGAGPLKDEKRRGIRLMFAIGLAAFCLAASIVLTVFPYVQLRFDHPLQFWQALLGGGTTRMFNGLLVPIGVCVAGLSLAVKAGRDRS